MDTDTQSSCLLNEFNIILDIEHKIQETPLLLAWPHVKVHLDNNMAPLDS